MEAGQAAAVAMVATLVLLARSLTGVIGSIFKRFIIQLELFIQLIWIAKFNLIMSGFIIEYLLVKFIIPKTECFKYLPLSNCGYKTTKGHPPTSGSGYSY